MAPQHAPFINGIIRICSYAAITSIIFLLMYIDAVTIASFGETSLVEIAQSVLLFVITLIFALSAIRIPAMTTSAWLLATFSAASLVRENDMWLDMLHSDGWQILVTPILAAGLYHTWKNRAQFLREQEIYTQSASFGLLTSAILTTYLFSRLYGMGVFWKAVFQERYIRAIKDMSEECLELFGYGLLQCAALEFVALARRVQAARGRPALPVAGRA